MYSWLFDNIGNSLWCLYHHIFRRTWIIISGMKWESFYTQRFQDKNYKQVLETVKIFGKLSDLIGCFKYERLRHIINCLKRKPKANFHMWWITLNIPWLDVHANESLDKMYTPAYLNTGTNFTNQNHLLNRIFDV